MFWRPTVREAGMHIVSCTISSTTILLCKNNWSLPTSLDSKPTVFIKIFLPAIQQHKPGASFPGIHTSGEQKAQMNSSAPMCIAPIPCFGNAILHMQERSLISVDYPADLSALTKELLTLKFKTDCYGYTNRKSEAIFESAEITM